MLRPEHSISVTSVSVLLTGPLRIDGYMNLSSTGQMPEMEEVDTNERLEHRHLHLYFPSRCFSQP